VLSGSDAQGVCAGLGYARSPVSDDVIGICWRHCCRVVTRRRARHRVGKHRVVPLAGPGFEDLDRRVRRR
jgi:hypothetical protein